jgi:quercetin dioxygenase-like cupin family protein
VNPGQVILERDVDGVQAVGDTVEVFELINPSYFAEPLVHRSMRVSSGRSVDRADDSHDEFLYVLEGSARVNFADDLTPRTLREGSAVYIRAGRIWNLDIDDAAWILSFLVPAPGTPWADALVKPSGEVVDVAELGAQMAQAATSDRQFEVLFDASRGSRGATMFVGFIPTSGAPEHYHLYDEICVIVGGSGNLLCQGSTQQLRRGSAFHVAPRLLHALENPNPDDLWVLGVFRPEGSAAAAYYPDGTPAPNNEE